MPDGQMASNGVVINKNRVWIKGERLPDCPAPGNCTAIINDKVYIDGYEYKNGKWKKTLRAWCHTRL